MAATQKLDLNSRGEIGASWMLLVNPQVSSARTGARRIVHAGQMCMMALLLSGTAVSQVFARSWSYHYRPITQSSPSAATTPAPGEQLTTARLLKRAIVSDLATFVQEQEIRSAKASARHWGFVVSHLMSFDPLSSPDALGLFATLAGYFLGTGGEEAYDCLSLRKGKILEPYLVKYLQSGSHECTQELGDTFTKPSDALEGHALCVTNQEQQAHLGTLLAKIDAGQSCSDAQLAAISCGTQASSANAR